MTKSNSKPRSDLESFLKENEHLREFYRYIGLTNTESDRGIAILTGVALDEALLKLLGKFLIINDSTKNLIHYSNPENMEMSPPLGSFATRELASFAFGLISEEEYQNCKRIRQIRNKFAHNISTDFQDKKIKKYCDKLPNYNLAQHVPELSNKVIFMVNSVVLLGRFLSRSQSIQCAQPQYDVETEDRFTPIGIS